MANVSACIKDTFHFWWVGFYRVKDEELVLGPFQRPLACTRIKKGRGVCGTAWNEAQTIIVPDVDSRWVVYSRVKRPIRSLKMANIVADRWT